MDFLEKPQRPQRFRIYLPDGTHMERVGWVHMGYVPPPKESCHLMFTGLGEKSQSLNKLAVVVNVEGTDPKIVYSPRDTPKLPPWAGKDIKILTKDHREWLTKNPHWPKVLELDWDNRDEELWDW